MQASNVSAGPAARGGASRGAPVGTIAELWRYPVKSMLGTRVPELHVTRNGGVGDRAWALRDLETGRIASAKRVHRLLDFRARYDVEPAPGHHGRVSVRTPDGRTLHPDDPGASEDVSAIVGHALRFEDQAREDERTGIDRGTVFGDVPVSAMKPDWTRETMPDYFQRKAGSFFEIGARFVLASGSVEHLRTAARHHKGCLGVYASVRSPGVVRTGDPVTLLR